MARAEKIITRCKTEDEIKVYKLINDVVNNKTDIDPKDPNLGRKVHQLLIREGIIKEKLLNENT